METSWDARLCLAWGSGGAVVGQWWDSCLNLEQCPTEAKLRPQRHSRYPTTAPQSLYLYFYFNK